MMNLFKKIHISYLLYFLLFISLISGLFKDIIVFLLIITIHEIGHIITSLIYGWNIKKINFSIVGGYIEYSEKIDKPFIEEILISISGFFMQWILFLITIILYKNGIIGLNLYNLIKSYNLSIFIFNVIPIIPLDGSKLLYSILCIFYPYKRSLVISSIISIVLLILLIIFICFNKVSNFSVIMVLTFIIKKVYLYIKDIPYLYNKFLLERYINKTFYKKTNIIKSLKLHKIKRQKTNYFYKNGKYVSEYILLKERFNNKKISATNE